MSQQPIQQRPTFSRAANEATEKHAAPERRSLPTTESILSRGVSLGQVLQAVRKLKPHISQGG